MSDQISEPRLVPNLTLQEFGTASGALGAGKIFTAELDFTGFPIGGGQFAPIDWISLFFYYANGATAPNGNIRLTLHPAPLMVAGNTAPELPASNEVRSAVIDPTTLIASPTTLNGAATPGSDVVTVVSSTNYKINRGGVYLDAAPNNFSCVYGVKAKPSGTQLRLDRGAEAAYASGTTVREVLVEVMSLRVAGTAGAVLLAENLGSTGSDPSFGLKASVLAGAIIRSQA